MPSRKHYLVAGLAYLVIIVCGLYSEGIVRMGLLMEGDAASTARNIRESELLFRSGLVGDLFMILADIVVAVIFYRLLKPVSELVALLAAAFRLAQASVIAANLVNHLSPLLLLSGASGLQAMQVEQLEALALFHLQSHGYGYLISQVLFAFNCFAMGYLLHRSTAFPRLLGIAVGLSGFAYLADALTNFLLPAQVEAVSMVLLVPVVTEISFCVWLIAKGIREPRAASLAGA